jgi:hypothetical protein
MFLINSIYIYVESFFKKKNENSFYQDDAETFFKFYSFYHTNESYFSKFFKKFNLNFNSNFLYLYFIYYISKKNKLITPGDYVMFFYMTFFLNKSFFLKTFKSVKLLDFSNKFKSLYLYTNNTQKDLENVYKSFNIKLEKFNNNYAPLSLASFVKTPANFLKSSYIKYSSTSLVKYINNSTDFSVYFLRKNKSFNKGRYSRNRQNYRTGVY